MTETEQNINIIVNKYQNSKIYTIRSHQTDLFYIGSTCNSLSKRFNEHKSQNQTSSKKIIDYGDAYIELLELFPCNSKIELNKREGELIRFYKDNIVNVKIDGRTPKEYCFDNQIICNICNKSYNIHQQNKHMKSKHHLHKQEIFNLKNKLNINKE
jgi:hypothetical protein